MVHRCNAMTTGEREVVDGGGGVSKLEIVSVGGRSGSGGRAVVGIKVEEDGAKDGALGDPREAAAKRREMAVVEDAAGAAAEKGREPVYEVVVERSGEEHGDEDVVVNGLKRLIEVHGDPILPRLRRGSTPALRGQTAANTPPSPF